MFRIIIFWFSNKIFFLDFFNSYGFISTLWTTLFLNRILFIFSIFQSGIHWRTFEISPIILQKIKNKENQSRNIKVFLDMEVRQVSSAIIMELYLEKRGKIRMAGLLKPESFRRKFFYGITYLLCIAYTSFRRQC